MRLVNIMTRAINRIIGPATSHNVANYWFPGEQVKAGVRVNENTAWNCSAVFAATEKLSNMYAATPIVLYRKEGSKRIEAEDKHLHYLLKWQPNVGTTAYNWKKLAMIHYLMKGNALTEIERDQTGKPVNLYGLNPDHVYPVLDDSQRAIYGYVVEQPNTEPRAIPARNMLHWMGPTFNGYWGLGRIELAKESIGGSIAQQNYGNTFYRNGASLSGVLSRPAGSPRLTTKAKRRLRDDFERLHQGVDKAHRTAVLEDGMEYKPISVSPEQAQFLESRKFSVEEIARWFDVPLHMLKAMDRSTFNNIEHQSGEFVAFAMEPHYENTEQQYNTKLLLTEQEYNSYVIDHDTRKILDGDKATRFKCYDIGIRSGMYCPDECREKEGDNPIRDGFGSRYMVPLNTMVVGEDNAKGNQDPNEPPVVNPVGGQGQGN